MHGQTKRFVGLLRVPIYVLSKTNSNAKCLNSFNYKLFMVSRKPLFQGVFVSAACKMLNIELVIVVTNISTPIIPSGLGGPVQRINAGNDRLIFATGLIRNRSGSGHYQYLLEGAENEPEQIDTNAFVSPVKLRRSRIITNYLKSPSPKKQMSRNHCHFCNANCVTAVELESHLNIESLPCQQSYMRNYKTKSLEPILASQFNCYFCSTAKHNRISLHLKSNEECKLKYFRRFNVTTIKELMSKLESLRRSLRGSRSRASRNLENERRKVGKTNREDVKTQAEILTMFRRESTFSNVKLCYKCLSNVCRAEMVSADEVFPSTPSQQSDQDNKELFMHRRFETFFMCASCKNGGETLNTESKVKMRRIIEDKNIIIVPECSVENIDQEDIIVPEDCPVTCLLPATLEALHHIDHSGLKNRSSDAATMLKSDPAIDTIVSISYENEVFKYRRAKIFSDRYQGVLKVGQERMLSSAEKVSNESNIVGSMSWQRIEKQKKLHRFEQHGPICFSISIEMTVQEMEVASCLIQSNQVISVEYRGSSTSELETFYIVHSHLSDQDCTETCTKMDLAAFLSVKEFDKNCLKEKFLATHLFSIQIKLQSFIKCFLKDTSSSLHSEDYSIRVIYRLDGTNCLSGYIWPKELESFNLELAKYPNSEINPEISNQAIKYIDKNIGTSTSPHLLRDQFQISEVESVNVADLVRKHQYHYCAETEERRDCQKCNDLPLPALFTDFVVCPSEEFVGNIDVAATFRNDMLTKLKSVSQNEFETLSTEDWLKKVFENFDADVCQETRTMRVDYDGKSIYVLVDRRLLILTGVYENDPLLGLYHYLLTCRGIDELYSVVLKRTRLKDCHTKPFSLGLIKAFKAEQEILPVNGYKKERDDLFKNNQNPPMEPISIDQIYRSTHREVSLAETLSLLDKNILRSISSTSTEYINAQKDRKLFFKKVSEQSDKSFLVSGMNGFFELQNSNIDTYFSRTNGSHVTLIEFCSWFEYIGAEESRQMFKIVKVNEEFIIKDSDVVSAADDTKFLPELILTSSERVYKIRSCKKIVTYPEFQDHDKHCFSKVLMYIPLEEEPKEEENILDLFNQSSGIDGSRETNIQRIER